MSNKPITGGTVLKLVIYSFIVGYIMYSMEWSPGDILGWVADTIAGIWNWFSGSGLEYVLLGATIVVPIFLFTRFRDRMQNRRTNRPDGE